MFRKKVKLLLERLPVCIFAEIVFRVRCTLNSLSIAWAITLGNLFLQPVSRNKIAGEVPYGNSAYREFSLSFGVTI